MKKKNTANLLILAPLSLFLFSCGNNKNAAKDAQSADSKISGSYVNITFLNNITDHLPQEIPLYCLELNFFSDDSVYVFNGFEGYKLAYKKQGDAYVLIDASFKGDMAFKIQDSTLILKDTAWTGITGFSEFKKIPDVGEEIYGFERYLNEQIIAGDYLLLTTGETTGPKVSFMAEGSVNGFSDYNKYEVCYGGDCIETPAEPSYTITFYGKKSTVDYAFTLDKKNKEISFYELAAPIVDIKGYRQIQEKVFTLKRSN